MGRDEAVELRHELARAAVPREHLRRYWFRFADHDAAVARGAAPGCGVTAVDRRDAERLVRTLVFRGEPLPEVAEAVEDVDLPELDSGHVLPNMSDPTLRGVWFPRV